MKRLFGALAAAALLLAPLSVSAQGRGMGGHGGFGGMRGGFAAGGFSHGGFARGGWGGGWRGGGWHGGGWRGCWGCFAPWWGFGLGFAAAYPWYYWGDPSWYWGPPAPYYGYYYGPSYNYGPPRVAAPVACGNWVWHSDAGRYVWVPCGQAAPQAAPPAPAYQAPPPAYNQPPAYAPAPRG